jgi:hypothetical protein
MRAQRQHHARLTQVLLQHRERPHRAVDVLCVVGDVALARRALVVTQGRQVIAA